MRKITLMFLLIASISFAQEKEYTQDKQKRHEVKLNVSFLIFTDVFDASYEYLINEESSFGVGLLYNFTSDIDNKVPGLGIGRKFSLTPYYRKYFFNKFAEGFFVEGFGMIHNYNTEENEYSANHGNTYYNEDKTEIALGVSIGKKYVTKRGFVLEIYLGLGRNLFGSSNSTEAVGRGGFSVGYRF